MSKTIELINKNKSYIGNIKITKNNLNYIKNIVNKLNKEKIIIISGIKNVGKTQVISEMIKKTKIESNFFYFNNNLDNVNIIKNDIDLKNMINIEVNFNKDIKYIFLQNISKIENIKDLIIYLYKSDFKVILIGNDIKIPNIQEIEIKNSINEDIEKDIIYGNLGNTYYLNDTNFKKEYINLIKDNILLNQIFCLKSVKNINLYNLIITKLALLEKDISLREFHRDIEKVNNISLVTMMDYIDFSIQEKIIKRVEFFDFKTNTIKVNKVRYYFCDNGFRNCLTNFDLSRQLLIENIIFVLLNYNNYNIYTGVNGVFEINFYAKKEDKEIIVYLSEQKEKNNIKKEIKKLQKIAGTIKKYLVVEKETKYNFKETTFGDVEIVTIEELIKKI
ncbi:MAG: AAA family ATPase [Candidatus Gracilibacteria bacterium]|nr:AAA family ATPase [Candidatus Gracilibacteria bacterium]